MAQPRNFHLFNCDNAYQLTIVEHLLMATKARPGLEFLIEKHSFALSKMSELTSKTIPAIKMDFAMFVVHAHESGLLINNDNLEHGYTLNLDHATNNYKTAWLVIAGPLDQETFKNFFLLSQKTE